jgi:hypothetical protein
LFSGILVVLMVGVAEGVLRLQQRLGPIYDLEMREVDSANTRSEFLNHRIPAGERHVALVSPEVYGKHSGKDWRTVFTDDGIQINKLRSNWHPGAKTTLFMGDSFMLGYDETNTIPHHVYQRVVSVLPYAKEQAFLNAGCFSYSPSIYIPQANVLIPKLKPEFLVVSIDETDLGDDYYHYRQVTTRGPDGRITAVRVSPLGVAFHEGLERARSQPLYSMRAVNKWVYTKLIFPKAEKEYTRTYYTVKDDLPPLPLPESGRHTAEIILRPVRLSEQEARVQCGEAIAYFESTVDELCGTLIRQGVAADRILFTRHPHPWHFTPEASGRVWNHLVTDVVRKVVTRHGIRFYDAEPDLKRAFGSHPGKYYWIHDMHFNFDGLRIYGQFIADELVKLMAVGKHASDADR